MCMTKYTFDDIEPGTAWACKFRARAMVHPDGSIVDTRGLQPGEAVKNGAPGVYESIGVIAVRDLEARKLVVKDTRSQFEFAIPEEDAWDFDTVEFVDND